MKVVLLPDYHGVEEIVNMQIEYLKKYKSKTTIIYHEPIPSTFDAKARLLASEGIRVNNFWDILNLPDHWGPSDPYLRLYQFSHDLGYTIGSMDHMVEMRTGLANNFRLLIENHRRRGYDRGVRMQFDKLKRRLSFGREFVFCESVDQAKYGRFETAVAIMHPDHIKRCRPYFEFTQGYEIDELLIDPIKAKELSEKQHELQLAYAEKNDIINSKKKPPLVPVVVMAWNEVKMNL